MNHTFRPVDPAADAELLHGWVTQPYARFWGMLAASVDDVREEYDGLAATGHHEAFLGLRDGVPEFLVERYRPAESPLNAVYQVQPGDVGMHLLVAPPSSSGTIPGFTLGVMLFRFMRPLVEHGHVFLAQPPLYKIKWGGRGAEPEYAYSDRELQGLIEAGREAGKKLPKEEGVQRYKGLGEMNAKELWETTMDPTNRILRLVTLDDAATADELFSVLMGEDVEARRSFIIRNAKDVRFLDI